MQREAHRRFEATTDAVYGACLATNRVTRTLLAFSVSRFGAARICTWFVLVAACSGSESASPADAGSDAESPVVEEIRAIPDYKYPDESLVDWVSFSDQLSEVEVVAEHQIDEPQTEEPAGRGYVPRRLLVNVVQTIWKRLESTETAPKQFELGAFGWAASGEKLRPLVAKDAARLLVGGRYVMPLLFEADSWSVLTSRCAFAANDSEIALSDIRAHGQNEVASMLAALSYEKMQELLVETKPYPAAAMNPDQPPSERLKLVQAAGQL